ncbi:MAG: GGDEF domain-containing protein [Chloroflexi bacterium]|nr:GGDEF domain-containing protein [Chloroflexota bacterium]
MKKPLFLAKNETVGDVMVALAWTIFVGMPLFTLHMLILDYEHYVHGMSLQFSLEMSFKNMIPYHPISIGLWLVAVFITAYSLRRSFRKQREVLAMKGQVRRSQIESLTDELTGALNRRAFDRQFESSLSFAKLENQPLTIIMVDVDKFKSLNDQYGHIVGDEALRLVANHLTKLVRTQDTVARYGGDEFSIICPGLSGEGAKSLVNRLKASIPPMGIELSLGIATYPFDGKNATELLEHADSLMYQDKENHHTKSDGVKTVKRQFQSVGILKTEKGKETYERFQHAKI